MDKAASHLPRLASNKGVEAFSCNRRLHHPTHEYKLMKSRQANIQEDTYFRVMRILHENPDLTQRELAKALGISLGGLNYCLKALTEKGWLKMQSFASSKNKFGYIYVLTPHGIKEQATLTHRFLKRKLAEYEALKTEIEALTKEHLWNDHEDLHLSDGNAPHTD